MIELMQKTILDLFCGAGGFAAGFQTTGGFEIIGAIDSGYEVSLTYQHNFPNAIFLNEDIHELHSQDILEKIKTVPDVIIASPPCEPYTSANTRRQKDPLTRLYDDEVGWLVLDTIRIIGDIHPDLFVVENVPELMSGELKWALQREFKRVGYDDVHFNVLLAEEYGTPSTRTRLFMSNIRIEPIRLKHQNTVQRVLNLPEPTAFHDFLNHQYYSISPKKTKKMRNLKPGNAMVYFRSATLKTYTNWVRLNPTELAPTVIGHSRFIHPFEDRVLSVRENARLMGFPDNFEFFGGIDAQYDMVGEAVPPPLSSAIAKYCLKWLHPSFIE
jgi:DNA (cytosine-5)-methyltransferase 1